MKTLINLLNETLLLEKRIAQIKSNITIEFNFDVIKSGHVEGRRTRNDIEDYNKKYISNNEIAYFIDFFKDDIAKAIALGNIKNEDTFIIRSASKELACVIVAQLGEGTLWRLKVITVFRESLTNKLKTWKGQFNITK